MLSRYESQDVLFQQKVSRQALLDLGTEESEQKEYSINVWRNHAFETLLPLMQPYFQFGRWQARFEIGAYDDTLMMSDWSDADVELLWLDSDRYVENTEYSEWLKWLSGRLQELRARSGAPIVVATWVDGDSRVEQLQSVISQVSAAYFADIGELCRSSELELIDRRTARLTGTPVSNPAQVVIARELACRWLPALLLPPIKAVALDLDYTLHDGVLGEDGIDGVRLTSEHAELQSFIKTLQMNGVFIALVSRNELDDVEALFRGREDYPLRWEDFSSVQVNWDEKAANLSRIASDLRIALDAVLYVDDNIGELSSITMQLPDIHAVFAHKDASLTRQVVRNYPGLWRWNVGEDDLKRIADLKANAKRDRVQAKSLDTSEYFRSLQVSLLYRNDPVEQAVRLYELANKTNQFNLALRRSKLAQIESYMERSDAGVASVQLADRLTDSGVIAIIIAVLEGERMVIEEICISCRALGRKLESMIILNALKQMPIIERCDELVFQLRHGERNAPARDWLSELVGAEEALADGEYSIPVQRVREFVPESGVKILVE